MNDHEQQTAFHKTDDLPALLDLVQTIQLKERERIEKDAGCVFKGDTVLDQVHTGFVCIPLELYRHTIMLQQICCN